MTVEPSTEPPPDPAAVLAALVEDWEPDRSVSPRERDAIVAVLRLLGVHVKDND